MNATAPKRQNFHDIESQTSIAKSTCPPLRFFCLLFGSPFTTYSYPTLLVVDSLARRRQTSSKALAMDNPPNANIHTIVKAQIVFLLSTLTEDNFDRNQIEIRSVGTNLTDGYFEAEITDINIGSACAAV
jgi:hypothetical protein